MPTALVCIAWAAPACIALLVGVVDMEDVVIILVEEAPLKATDAGVVAVGLMETAVLLGLRTLMRDVSMCYILIPYFRCFAMAFGNTRVGSVKGYCTCQ
jgi:hypothetical protein